jgi:hypothetical protein
MNIRFVSICFLVLVLLNSAMGSVLAATLCPHVSGAMSCCSAEPSKQHEHTDGMQMDGMQAEAPSTSTAQEQSATSVGEPRTICSHCITHSKAVSVPVFLREADHKNAQVGAAAPKSFAQALVPFTASVHLISVRSHAPPGPRNPRYILLSVFRI